MTSAANREVVEAWEGALFDHFREHRSALAEAIGPQGEEALRRDPPRSGQRVVDIGCGFGETTRRLAGLVGPGGEALGVDASEPFIAIATAEAAAAGTSNCRYAVADVQEGVPGRGFDRAFSRMGTMFFADPEVAMAKVREALVTGGVLTMVVWRAKAENDYMWSAERIAAEALGEGPRRDGGPGPFSLSDPASIRAVLGAAGWVDVSPRRSDQPAKLGATLGEAAAFACGVGPAGALIRESGERGAQARPGIEAAVAADFERYVRDDGVWAETATWIVTARNPG